MVRVRSRRWCITLNNYTAEEELSLQSLVSQDLATYLVYGREVGDSGTPHLQMYLEVPKKVGLRSIKRMPGLSRCHAEKARGSFQSNKDYCTKEDNNPFEEGSPIKQGRRSDLEEIRTHLDGGGTVEDVASSYFGQWVMYRRAFKEYVTLKLPHRTWKPKVFVLWGNTGTGKTRFCFDQVQDQTYWMPGDYSWFDGYEGQPIVILDDYRGEYPLQLLLKLLDRYPMTVPIKGGFAKWLPKKIYITSNLRPEEWYKQSDFRSIAALMRRFDSVEFIIDSLY
jgi:hypothetical protein